MVEAYNKLKIMGEPDKVKISMVEADSISDPFLLLQYDIHKFSVICNCSHLYVYVHITKRF
jgi:hypothetical protein